MLQHAHSIFTLKSLDSESRTLTGIATTPEVDAMGDIVEPRGGVIRTPTPLLWQHDAKQPIGTVTRAVVDNNGITITAQIAKVDEPGTLKDRLDEVWSTVKAGLARGLSIGFQSLEAEPIRGGGMRFLRWALREISVVTIPACAGAQITSVKMLRSFDARRPVRVVSIHGGSYFK